MKMMNMKIAQTRFYALLRFALGAEVRDVSGSGRYFNQQINHVTTTENMAKMLATERQMGPAGEGGLL